MYDEEKQLSYSQKKGGTVKAIDLPVDNKNINLK